MPSKQDILEFIQTSSKRVGKREIARAFAIKGSQRTELKRVLREMAEEGLIEGSRRALSPPGLLPPVCVIEVVELDADGEPIARPDRQASNEDQLAKIRLLPSRGRGRAAGLGDRVLARLEKLAQPDEAGCGYEARAIKILPRERERLLGLYRALESGGVIDPIDRRQLKEWRVKPGDEGEAKDGELVRFAPAREHRYGVPQARILERLGDPAEYGSQSLIAIHVHGLRDAFPGPAESQAAACQPVELGVREDLRHLPLVTIDPEGARDHDDAVWAAPSSLSGNETGWCVIVAIADVAHYVAPGSALDREALLRGNSVYFADRVVPMLPERLSGGLCSLVSGEDRAVLAVRMEFDANGAKREHRFFRALIRSAASLTYEDIQRAHDYPETSEIGELIEPIVAPLFGAYGALAAARDKRAPLDLDLPERRIEFDDQGKVKGVVTPARLDAHRLIEEFMIQANVAAAEALEAKSMPLIYRVHDHPSAEKLEALREFLATLDLKLPKANQLRPSHINQVLAIARERDLSMVVGDVVLRSQAQAEYSPANYGHFGLNLVRYAHFTSPIRRYADLTVHRSLIRAYGLGDDGLEDDEIERLETTAEAISQAERRAMAAERETQDRLISEFLSERIGARFSAVVSGAAKSGLFVRLNETGAEGFVPASTIGREFYRYDEKHHALYGEASGREFALGDRVEVRLVEAIPSAGALRFELLSEGTKRQRKRRTARAAPKRRHKRARR